MSFYLKALFALAAIMLLVHADPVFAQGGGGPAGIPLIEYIFARVVCVAVPLGYTALLVVLVIAGIKYLSSGGEPKAISQAHQTVTWGLLGVLFLAIAWLILQLVQSFTGVKVTEFTLASLPGVQGFSGQCFGPAPIAPEPARQIARSPSTSQPTSQTPTEDQPTWPTWEDQECTEIPETTLPPFRYGGREYPVYICPTSLTFCSVDEANLLYPRGSGRGAIPSILEPIPSEFVSSPIYNSPDEITELEEVLDNPETALVLTGALDNTLYIKRSVGAWAHGGEWVRPFQPITENVVWFLTHKTAPPWIFAKYPKGHIPLDLLRAKYNAWEVAFRLSGYDSSRHPHTDVARLYRVECEDGNYYNATVYTPHIYLYPSTSTSVSLKINSAVVSPQLTLSNGSWQVVASPDGTLTTPDGNKHRFIPYEFLRNDFKRPEKGFVVEGAKLEDYLKNNFWPKLGLTKQEIEDYWQDTKGRVNPSPYYFISLIDRSEIDRVLPMEVNPKPDTVLRDMTYILPLSQPPSMSIMPLEKEKLNAPKREGFTVLENGVFTDGK